MRNVSRLLRGTVLRWALALAIGAPLSACAPDGCSPPGTPAPQSPPDHPPSDLRDSSQLSPPSVVDSVHECATKIYVYGYKPNALVKVYVNDAAAAATAGHPQYYGSELYGEGEIEVPDLKVGDRVRATQTVNAKESERSINPATVSAYSPLSKPEITGDLFDCGRIAPVNQMMEGTIAHITETSVGEIGVDEVTRSDQAILTKAYTSPHKLKAQNIACELSADKARIPGPESNEHSINPKPLKLDQPTVEKSNVIPGNNVIVADGTVIGAMVIVHDTAATPDVVAQGFATGTRSRIALNSPLQNAPNIKVEQKLCELSSGIEQPGVKATASLPALSIVDRFCDTNPHSVFAAETGAKLVEILGSTFNADVLVYKNDKELLGLAGAADHVMMWLGSKTSLVSGDKVTAYQRIGGIWSPRSNEVKAAKCPCVPAGDKSCAINEDCCAGSACRDGKCIIECPHDPNCSVPGKKGECKKGRWKCTDTEKTCEPVVSEKPEVCDGKDNDCDDVVDNNPTDLGSCTDPPSSASCQPGFRVDAKQKCTSGKKECDAKEGVDFCTTNGPSCGSPGATPCTPGATKCVPGHVCKMGNSMGCAPADSSTACWPIDGAHCNGCPGLRCWKPSDVKIDGSCP